MLQYIQMIKYIQNHTCAGQGTLGAPGLSNSCFLQLYARLPNLYTSRLFGTISKTLCL